MTDAAAPTPIDLDAIRIASPCSARWEDMVGDDRSRHCQECRLQVHDLSAMTRAEAEEVLRSSTARTCVRLYRREDGRVMTADCPVGRRRRMKTVAGVVASLLAGSVVAVGALAVWAMSFSKCGSSSSRERFAAAQDYVAHRLGVNSLCTCSVLMGSVGPRMPIHRGDGESDGVGAEDAAGEEGER